MSIPFASNHNLVSTGLHEQMAPRMMIGSLGKHPMQSLPTSRQLQITKITQ